MSEKRMLTEIDQADLERIANIIGAASAAAQALNDATRRRETGERVAFYRDKSGAILVGPDWRAAYETPTSGATNE